MLMRKLLLTISALLILSCSMNAQDSFYDKIPFQHVKNNYNQARIVAQVKIKSIKFAAPDVYPVYVMQCEIIEPFKGNVKRGEVLDFYYSEEPREESDLNGYLGEWIVFLEGKFPIPPREKGWYEMEFSRL